MTERVLLGAGEIAVASVLAALRQGVNREAGIVNQKAGKQDPMTTELVGIYAELAFAKWANVYPDLTTHLRKGTADAWIRGRSVDVKGTRNPHGDLYVDMRSDKKPDLYVLVHVEYATCTILGWVSSHRASSLMHQPGRISQESLFHVPYLRQILDGVDDLHYLDGFALCPRKHGVQ